MPRSATHEAKAPDKRNPLAKYWSKRDFSATSEPRGEHAPGKGALSFVIQKHAASHLHYDFRLELEGVLVSWAVPKGPSYDPTKKRLAIHVEDHPLSYGSFEGTIPKGHYGAGSVIVWDQGSWEPVGDPAKGLADGKLVFSLHGQKMAGLWELVRTSRAGERQAQWLLFKKRDAYARPDAEFDVVAALPDSVLAQPLTRASTDLPGATKAALPKKLAPQLALLASEAPQSGAWIYEIKFDGYRMLTRIQDGRARLFTRNGHDWSARMPALLQELEQLGIDAGWLDGEVVALDQAGLSSFSALQKAFDAEQAAELVYFLFDVPFLDGHDLRSVSLRQRREVLRAVLGTAQTPHVRLSEDFDAAPAALLKSACNMNLEGVIAKRADSAYASGRNGDWLKLKCKRRQEFVICGYTERSDDAGQVGSLLLGVHDEAGQLVSVGSVGTGWDTREARALKAKLAGLQIDHAPFAAGPAKKGRWSRRSAGAERWVRPTLVAEVAFAEWTAEQQLRHAAYLSLRTDKPAKAILREQAVAPASKPAARSSTRAVRITHGERVIDADSGTTKLDLLRYYESVADWILPHLKGRPVSLLRGPQGVAGELFFQKHAGKTAIPGIKELDPALWPGHQPLLEIASRKGLLGAAQMNMIELHTWNASTRRMDQPNRMIFDLDPGEGVGWPAIQEAATLVHALLGELGLRAWLKTSGGKGLHIVVPLLARYEFDRVKDFSKAIVTHLARTIPSRFVARSGPANRVGRIFVDYLRNGHGATTVAAFSARARPGLGVSMPMAWEQLPALKSAAHWTVANAREHLSFQKADPWAEYWTSRQGLKVAMDRLGYDDPSDE